MKKTTEEQLSPAQLVEVAAKNDVVVDRDTIGKWLEADLLRAHTVLTDILKVPALKNTLIDVYWEKYQTIQKTKTGE